MKSRSRMENNIVIGLSCFCSKCASELRSATCDDMNGNPAFCDSCSKLTTIQIGISVYSNSVENLQYCYEQMKEHHHLIKKLLSERNPS